MKLKILILIATAMVLSRGNAQAVSYYFTTDGLLSNYWDITLDLPAIDYDDIPDPAVGSYGYYSSGTLTMDKISTIGVDFIADVPELLAYVNDTSIFLVETHDEWLDAVGNGHRIAADTLDSLGVNIYPTTTSYIIPSNYSGHWTIIPDAAAVPEPASMLLIGSGLAGLLSLGRRKNN